ncbi:MAG: hypothetical protein H0U21_13385, partial [Acidimicrobiia bacterium]|nr:hypothetical protein [Acidimicrobiia bacterium]
RSVDAAERVLRVDIAVRAAAATLVEGPAQIAVVRAGTDGSIELTLTAGASLPAPWLGDGSRWTLSGSIPVELLADAARSVGAPCVALTQLGADDEGGDVLVDLEALGLLAIGGPPEDADAVVRGVAATLASSVFAELANLIGVGVDPAAFLGHRHAHHVDTVDEAVELATALVGTTAATVQSTFVLRARHTSGEAWEPAVVLTGATAAIDVTDELARTAARRRGGFALVVAGPVDGAPWSLRCGRSAWTLEPLGLEIVPVGLSVAEVVALDDLVRHAGAPLEPVVDGDPVDVLTWSDDVVDRGQDPSHDGDGHDEPVSGGRASAEDAAYRDPDWSLMVRLLGPVGVVDGRGAAVPFGRSKTLELVTWLALHREHSTRQGARTALWELDVRDATFANVVSEARRSMARHVAPPEGAEWLGRTLTEVLPLHDAVVTDADLVRARVEHARTLPPDLAIDTLRPAVELIVDAPFAGTGYLWPDPEGLTSNLVLLATGAATDLAGHCLSMGDVDGVFWATGQGLKVLPGHEELIGLRMRAHARAGDLSGVRLEWQSYERVLDADRWGDGEPAEKLVILRKQLLST